MAKKLVVKNISKYDCDMRSFIGIIDELIYSEGKLENMNDSEKLEFIDDVLLMYINGSETYVYQEDEEWEGDNCWYISNFDVDIMKSLGWITQIDEDTLELDF